MARKTKDVQYYEAVGRRKEAIARVRLYIVGKDKSATIGGKKIAAGQIVVNDKPIDQVYPGVVAKKRYEQPFAVTSSQDRFAVTVHADGGGVNGQLEAVIHGISRALGMVNPEDNRPLLKEQHLLTRDPRARERRKVGTGGKARRQKQSPKR